MTVGIQILIKFKKQIKFRHELKHRINNLDRYDISSRLKKIFPLDINSNSHGYYRVSSLYFDTPYDKALREKVDGINKREKFRIRYYEDNLNFFKLEKKIKVNGLCGKISAKLNKQQVINILNNDIDFLLKEDHPLLIEFYTKLKLQQLQPKTVVVYDREAYIYNVANVRITLDSNIRTSTNVDTFLKPNSASINLSNNITVLEVKYDNFIPEIVSMATKIKNRQASAFSKYALCRTID